MYRSLSTMCIQRAYLASFDFQPVPKREREQFTISTQEFRVLAVVSRPLLHGEREFQQPTLFPYPASTGCIQSVPIHYADDT